MTKRRLPRWSELAPLIRVERPAIGRSAAVKRAATILELRKLGARRTPKAAFDYVDGAAESELSLWRARQGFRQLEFRPRVLRDVSTVDASTRILGKRASLPLILAPTGFTRMMHTGGESAVAKAVDQSGLAIPYALSTMGTTSIEDLQDAAPDVRRWFQLYVWKDRGRSQELIKRAAAADYDTLVLTVDTPVAGARLRDVRNGLTIPPALRWKTLVDGAMHPAWWFDLFTTEPLEFASLSHFDGTVAELVNQMFDPSVTFDDIGWLREQWDGSLVVKGIQSVEDARLCADMSADAIVISNHGGRQLDRAPTPLQRLPEVVDTVGDELEVYLDGGILSGSDVVAAVAAGAHACMVGRAYLYGLMAGGQEGVERALQILQSEVERTMQLLGAGTIGDLTPELVRTQFVQS